MYTYVRDICAKYYCTSGGYSIYIYICGYNKYKYASIRGDDTGRHVPGDRCVQVLCII